LSLSSSLSDDYQFEDCRYKRLTTTGVQKPKHKEQVQKIFYLFTDITPSYKLRAEENIVHDFLGRGYARHGGTCSLKAIHQVLVVVGVLLLREARLRQAKVEP
jgi:hypothetical protein